MKTTQRIYRMDRRQISFVKFVLEAYDNMAVVTTLDARHAVVRITIAPGCEGVVKEIVDDLADEIAIIPLDHPERSGDGTAGARSPAADGDA